MFACIPAAPSHAILITVAVIMTTVAPNSMSTVGARMEGSIGGMSRQTFVAERICSSSSVHSLPPPGLTSPGPPSKEMCSTTSSPTVHWILDKDSSGLHQVLFFTMAVDRVSQPHLLNRRGSGWLGA